MPSTRETIENKEVGLIDVLDVILDKGVAIRGDLIISIAGIDLVYLDLRILISSVETLVQSYENNRHDITSDEFEKQRRELLDATDQSE
ncbi:MULTISPECIES: gas vesicle protein [Staphylococcus]|uniref:gas vesicle protein n=1 Tax=Staphylococcus TaxID=1279 RepID=UPI000DF73E14|nr:MULTISPECIES: gas vesicle protein [unclassified Staphylococcus]UXV34670.1 gas vesicle protein [Staphylococcus sp. IVB6181]